MKRVQKLSFHILIYILLATILGVHRSHAQDVDSNSAEGLWRRAFILFESAEDLESQGELLDARNKANEAKMLYDAIANNYPDFQPSIIKYKQRVVAETYARIRENYRSQLISSTKPNRQQPAPQNQIQPQPLQPGSYQVPNRGDFTPVPANPNPQAFPPQPQTLKGPGDNNSIALPLAAGPSLSILQDQQRWQKQKDSEIEWLRKRNREAEVEVARKDRLLAERDRELAIRTRELENLRNDPSNASEQGRLLNKAMQVIRDFKAQNIELKTQLDAARAKIAAQSEQIKKLTRERDDLTRIVEGKSLGGEELLNLIEENKRLTDRLKYIKQIAERNSQDNLRKDQDIANLKHELEKIRADRDKLVQENVRHQVTIEGLHKKFESLSKDLTNKNKLVELAPEQRAENDLLKSVILKQLRNQAQQKQKKELVLQELAKVGAESEALLKSIEDMARGAQLTPEEKALFKSPQVAELLEESYSSEEYLFLSAPADPSKIKHRREGQKTRAELSQIEKAARLDFKEGRLDEAEAGFLNFLHYEPQNVACLCNLGLLKLKLSNHTEAQSYLQRAVAIDPDSALANYLLGRSYFQQKNFDEAYRLMEHSIRLNPKNDKAQNCFGVIASQKGWVSVAKKAFLAAIGINPNNADAHFNLAVLHTSQAEHDPKKVHFHYLKALEIYKAEQLNKGNPDPVVGNPAIEKFLQQHPVKGV